MVKEKKYAREKDTKIVRSDDDGQDDDEPKDNAIITSTFYWDNIQRNFSYIFLSKIERDDAQLKKKNSTNLV